MSRLSIFFFFFYELRVDSDKKTIWIFSAIDVVSYRKILFVTSYYIKCKVLGNWKLAFGSIFNGDDNPLNCDCSERRFWLATTQHNAMTPSQHRSWCQSSVTFVNIHLVCFPVRVWWCVSSSLIKVLLQNKKIANQNRLRWVWCSLIMFL